MSSKIQKLVAALYWLPMYSILALTPDEWHQYSDSSKEYYYHTDCVSGEINMINTCINIGGTTLASITSTDHMTWLKNELISVGISECSHKIAFGAKDPAGWTTNWNWLNGDEWNVDLINFQSGWCNVLNTLNDFVLYMDYFAKAFCDDVFTEDYSIVCERDIIPTQSPSFDPTQSPSFEPSPEPTSEPTIEPTTEPTMEPSGVPSSVPTNNPSNEPTYIPSQMPSSDPSYIPSEYPSVLPTTMPTILLSLSSANPTESLTENGVIRVQETISNVTIASNVDISTGSGINEAQTDRNTGIFLVAFIIVCLICICTAGCTWIGMVLRKRIGGFKKWRKNEDSSVVELPHETKGKPRKKKYNQNEPDSMKCANKSVVKVSVDDYHDEHIMTHKRHRIAMKYNLPINNLKMNVPSNSFNVNVKHQNMSIDVNTIDEISHVQEFKETAGFVSDDSTDESNIDAVHTPMTPMENQEDNTGSCDTSNDEGTKEISSHITNEDEELKLAEKDKTPKDIEPKRTKDMDALPMSNAATRNSSGSNDNGSELAGRSYENEGNGIDALPMSAMNDGYVSPHDTSGFVQ